MQLNLCKENANREQRHQARLRGYAEVQLFFCKVNKKKCNALPPHSFALKYRYFNVRASKLTGI